MPLLRKGQNPPVAPEQSEPAAPEPTTIETTVSAQPWWPEDYAVEQAYIRAGHRPSIVRHRYVPGDPQKGTDAYVIFTENT